MLLLTPFIEIFTVSSPLKFTEDKTKTNSKEVKTNDKNDNITLLFFIFSPPQITKLICVKRQKIFMKNNRKSSPENNGTALKF